MLSKKKPTGMQFKIMALQKELSKGKLPIAR